MDQEGGGGGAPDDVWLAVEALEPVDPLQRGPVEHVDDVILLVPRVRLHGTPEGKEVPGGGVV